MIIFQLHAIKFWKGWNRAGGWIGEVDGKGGTGEVGGKGGIEEVGGKGGTGEVGAPNLGSTRTKPTSNACSCDN